MAIELNVIEDRVLRPAVNKGAVEMIAVIAGRRGYTMPEAVKSALLASTSDQLTLLMSDMDAIHDANDAEALLRNHLSTVVNPEI